MKTKKSILLVSILLVILLLFIASCSSKTKIPSVDMDNLAACLASKNVKMYGSMTCSACAATRKMFGDSFKKITEIECNPNAPNTQAEFCIKKGIRKTPTWIMEDNEVDIKRFDGYQTADGLKEYFGC